MFAATRFCGSVRCPSETPGCQPPNEPRARWIRVYGVSNAGIHWPAFRNRHIHEVVRVWVHRCVPAAVRLIDANTNEVCAHLALFNPSSREQAGGRFQQRCGITSNTGTFGRDVRRSCPTRGSRRVLFPLLSSIADVSFGRLALCVALRHRAAHALGASGTSRQPARALSSLTRQAFTVRRRAMRGRPLIESSHPIPHIRLGNFVRGSKWQSTVSQGRESHAK